MSLSSSPTPPHLLPLLSLSPFLSHTGMSHPTHRHHHPFRCLHTSVPPFPFPYFLPAERNAAPCTPVPQGTGNLVGLGIGDLRGPSEDRPTLE